MKMMNLQCFAFLCLFDGFLNFWGCFFWKLTKPCRHARTFQLVSQQSLLTINNKGPNILTKRPPVATTVPSCTQRYPRALVYRGIPSDLSSRPEQPHHLPGALLPRWLQAVYRVSNGRPTFNSTEKALTFTIYDCVLRIRPKMVYYLTKVSPLEVELI